MASGGDYNDDSDWVKVVLSLFQQLSHRPADRATLEPDFGSVARFVRHCRSLRPLANR